MGYIQGEGRGNGDYCREVERYLHPVRNVFYDRAQRCGQQAGIEGWHGRKLTSQRLGFRPIIPDVGLAEPGARTRECRLEDGPARLAGRRNRWPTSRLWVTAF